MAMEAHHPQSPATFDLFLQLPPELRIQIYGEYFGSTTISPKSHKRTRHATALLLASKQLLKEARPSLYRCATLTLSLHPSLQHNTKDISHVLSRQLEPGFNLPGKPRKLARFRSIRITLPVPPPKHPFQRAVQTPEDTRSTETSTDWWQHVSALMWANLIFVGKYRVHSLTLAINLGDITHVPADPREPCLTRFATLPAFYNKGWKDMFKRRGDASTEEDKDAQRPGGKAEAFRNMPPACREIISLMVMIGWVASICGDHGDELRLENGDRSQSVTVTSDKLVDLIESARKLVSADEVKEVWLVVVPKARKKEVSK